MKNQRGITLIKLLIVIIAILGLILFINVFKENNSKNDITKTSSSSNNYSNIPIIRFK